MKIGGKYRIYETLGKGAFGKTHKVTNFRDPYALKEIEIKSTLDESSANTEIEAHENLPRHENVVTLLDHFTENNNLYVVFEFCEPGNLNDFAVNEKMDEVAVNRATKDIVNGLRHLHKLNVVHGNVKPQNILMTMTHGNKPVFKISDFNLTRHICAKDALSSALMPNQPLLKYVNGECGMVLYWAPEFGHGEYTTSGDVFSVGAIVFALHLMRTVNKQICPAIKGNSGDEKPIALCTDEEIETAVKGTVVGGLQTTVTVVRMLLISASDRPTFDEVMTHIE